MRDQGRQFALVAWLALRDFTHEWRMSACFVLALASVLAPMMLLFGLKFGIVTSMVDRLVADPFYREIRAVGSGRYTPAWFQTLSQRPDVAFLLPRTRSIAATAKLSKPGQPRILTVEMIPSAKGDPLIGPATPPPSANNRVVVSHSVARKLRLAPGDRLQASLGRIFHGKRERVHWEMVVNGIADAGSFGRDGIFISLQLLVAAEDFRDGQAVPAMGWDGSPPLVWEKRTFTGYRLYTRSIFDVAAMLNHLTTQGLEVRTNAREIGTIKSIDKNLRILFWVIALVGLSGFSVSLGASLWANVERKRRELSVLRLTGLPTAGIVLFPVFQGFYTGALGWMLASATYLSVEQTINQMFAGNLQVGQTICRLLPIHFAGAAIITLLSAVTASLLSGFRASRITPSEGLREI